VGPTFSVIPGPVETDTATKREAAEQLAADRAEHITDLRRSLLMLEAGRPAQPPEWSLTLVPDAHAPEPLRATGGQAWWRRRGR